MSDQFHRTATLLSDGERPCCGAFRILVVDEHPIVRRGLAALLNERPDFVVCGEADNLPDAINLVHELHPHLVTVELSLQKGSGLELIKELAACGQAVKIVVFSLQDEMLFAERVLRAGAHGYVGKDTSLPDILNAIDRVLEDRVYLSDQMTDRMLSRAVRCNGDDNERSPIESLSDRELEVFEQLGRGVTTRQIARQLYLSPKTIETYRENIKLKLKLRNAAELTQHAVQWVLEKKT